MAERPDGELWRDTLPIMGVDGSLTTVQADSESAGKVFAKTGTLAAYDAFNGRFRIVTKTLGGVMDAESGRTLLFTVIMNNAFATPTPTSPRCSRRTTTWARSPARSSRPTAGTCAWLIMICVPMQALSRRR